MKTTLSGCDVGCEIDMALTLTDVPFRPYQLFRFGTS
jgi:hypothetical protein